MLRRGAAILMPKLRGPAMASRALTTIMTPRRPLIGRALTTMRPEDLESLGISKVNDEELKSFFDELSSETGTPGVPPSLLAERLARAHGFDPAVPVQSASLGGVYGTDLGAAAYKLLMTWTAKRIDTNADGVISWSEFRAAVRQTEASLLERSFFSEEALNVLGIDAFDDEKLRAAFDAADADGSGELDAAEVRTMLTRTNPALEGSAELEQMLARVMERLDTDGDTGVSFEEWRAAFGLYQTEQGWWKHAKHGLPMF